MREQTQPNDFSVKPGHSIPPKVLGTIFLKKPFTADGGTNLWGVAVLYRGLSIRAKDREFYKCTLQ